MYTNIVRGLTGRKSGKITIVVLLLIVIPVLITSMTEVAMTNKQLQERLLGKIDNRYEDFSCGELAAFQVMNDLNGVDLDGLVIDDFGYTVERKMFTVLGYEVQLELIDEISENGRMQVIVNTDNTKDVVIEIEGISLDADNIIDSTNCSIKRGVR